ncbi:hypothetical protein BJX61DRAFT_535733 [Aspergillus egyptiacus]|nr:hypothetical protein BJX61DRAFT_535733 [Aspergillus egyptiacus]
MYRSRDSSQTSVVEGLHDSVSRKRRHAIYFHRPPVWRYSSIQDGSSSPDMSEDLEGEEELEKNSSLTSLHLALHQNPGHAAVSSAPLTTFDSDSDHETPLLDGVVGDQAAIPDCRASMNPQPLVFRQAKPVFCTRLQSYKDVRLGMGERWSVQEGSLVIGIGSEYTLLDNHPRRTDEFDVAAGDVYVICSLYADLWALCAKMSFISSAENDDPVRLAFLPLCAVTLAPNYSAFVQRTTGCVRYPGSNVRKYPGNGLPVMPPQRSHSLTASKQAFQNLEKNISLPLNVQDVFQRLSWESTEDDFVPLDSTLETIFSPLTSRRQRLLRRITSRRSMEKPRGTNGEKERRKYDYDPTQSLLRKADSGPDGRRQLRKDRRSYSSDIQAFQWLTARF